MSTEKPTIEINVESITKTAVMSAARDAIAERKATQSGAGGFNATETYRLILADVEAEMFQSFVELTEAGQETGIDPEDIVKIQRRIAMHVWKHFPKNPSAFRQTFFEGEDKVEAIADPYADL